MNKKILFIIGVSFSLTLSVQGQGVGNYINVPNAPIPLTPHTSISFDIPYWDDPGIPTLFNCIRTWEPNQPFNDAGALVSPTLNFTDADVAVDYFDGLGRKIQTVVHNGVFAPTVKDWVKVYTYDNGGQEFDQPIPFASENVTGKFKSDAEYWLLNRAQNVYPGILPATVTIDDRSILHRPVMRHKPAYITGMNYNNWEQFYYQANTATEVFDIRIGDQNTSVPMAIGYYLANTLQRATYVDEDSKTTITYTDSYGRVIMTKKAISANSLPQQHTGWACTYYVYDELGNMRCVLPPNIVDHYLTQGAMGLNGINLGTSQVLSGSFFYFYDNKNRLIEKTVPNSGIEYYIYDNKDRLIFSQNGNQRTSNYWAFTLYDAKDRPYATGMYKPSIALSQTDMNTRLTGTYSPVSNEVFAWARDYTALSKTQTTLTDCEILTWLYYDRYEYPPYFTSASCVFDNSNVSKLTGVAPQAIIPEASTNLRDLNTAKVVKVMDGGNSWIKTQLFYDSWGRIVQEQKYDQSSSIGDITTNQYNFKNELESSVLSHDNPNAIAPSSFTHPNIYKHTTIVKSQEKYTTINKLHFKSQSINGETPKTIANYLYDMYGRVKEKQMMATTEEYKYNIRNQLTAINESHVVAGQVAGGLPRFGEIISYDEGFLNNCHNGNIAGIQWRGPGGNARKRCYGYMYDEMNRLSLADFGEYTTVTPTSPPFIPFVAYNRKNLDYSVPNIKYDLNGNIVEMDQRGTVLYGTPFDMDVLRYHYQNLSNKLQWIDDINTAVNPSVNNNINNLPDFKDISTAQNVNEYDYDANGNVTIDKNRDIKTPIVYDYNDKPTNITVNTKGNIQYVYDALGNKLRKVVTDIQSSTTTTYHYDGPFLYKNNELQFIYHDEGRCRPKTDPDQEVAKFTYDYFTKDHLGNVRATFELQETPIGANTNQGPAVFTATHEVTAFNAEHLVWDNIDAVWAAKPASTSPNDVMAAELDGNNAAKRVGTSLMLRVMPGDKFELNSDSYYEGEYQDEGSVSGQDLVSSLLSTLTGGAMLDGSPIGDNPENLNIINNCIGNPQFQTMYDNMIANNTDPSKPRGYLNYLAFDDNFQLVPNNSGVFQTDGPPNTWKLIGTQPNTQIEIGQAGYLLVFISSQSASKLTYFDRVRVANYSGSTLEEDHYYPYGLTLTTQPANPKNRNYIKYNSKELQRDEFTNPSTLVQTGLELYDYGARMQDPQIGRWNGVDIKATKYPQFSPYTYAADNPILFIDPDGQFPYTFHVRAFAPPGAFNRTGFHDDNRGFSTGMDVTSRIKQNFTVDPTARTFTGGQPTSDPTIWNGFSRTATDEGGASASFGKNSFGSAAASISSNFEGSNPFGFGAAPDIKVSSAISITENLKTNQVFVSLDLSSKQFPATEGLMQDNAGNTVFLEGAAAYGTALDLVLADKKQVASVDLIIGINNKGIFQNVTMGGKTYSLDDFNKLRTAKPAGPLPREDKDK